MKFKYLEIKKLNQFYLTNYFIFNLKWKYN